MNIIQIQDRLKDVSDNDLVNEMQRPSGSAPQYLVLSELQRRKRMRDEFQRQQAADMPTVAEEMVAAAGVPQGGIMQMAGAMAPKSSMAQDTGVNNMTPTPATRAPQEPMRMAEGGVIKMQQGSYRFGSNVEYNYNSFLAEMGLQDSPQARDMWRRYQQRMDAAPMPGPTRTMRGLDVPPAAPSALPGGEMGDLGINRVMGPVDFDATAPAMPAAPARPMAPAAATMPAASPETGGIASIPPIAGDMSPSVQIPMNADKVVRRPDAEEAYARANEFAGVEGPAEAGAPIGPIVRDVAEAVFGKPAVDRAVEGIRRRSMEYMPDETIAGMSGDELLPPAARPKVGDVVESEPIGLALPGVSPMEDEILRVGERPELSMPEATEKVETEKKTTPETGGGTGAGGGYGKIESRIEKMLADKEKRAESDKWLALAQAGMALMASKQPTLGGALGEAGLVGISQLRESQAQSEDDILSLLEQQRQIASSRAAAARSDRAPTTSATERAAYFRAANDAAETVAELELALTRGGEIGEFGEVTRPYSPEEISILTRQLNDARSRANMYSGLANPALANIQAAQ